MDKEKKDYVTKDYVDEKIHSFASLLDKQLNKTFEKNILSAVKTLDKEVDNKINAAVFKKLDVKWQAFSATLVILSIHAAVIFFIVK